MELLLVTLIYFALLFMATMFMILTRDGTQACYQSDRYHQTVFWKVCVRCAYESLINSKQYWPGRVKVYVPDQQSFPIPLRYIDVIM